MQLRTILFAVFCLLNSLMLYLFMLKLPYGWIALRQSLIHWHSLLPDTAYASGITFIIASSVFFGINFVTGAFKNGVLFFRRKHADPAYQSFFNTRKTPIDKNQLYKLFPEVQDSAYQAETQYKCWQTAYQRHKNNGIIANTKNIWLLLRDLYMTSCFYLAMFLITWSLDTSIPSQVTSPYLFLFGAQVLFLLISARSAGYRLVDNVLAITVQAASGK